MQIAMTRRGGCVHTRPRRRAHARQKDRPHGVDVLERIESDATKPPSCIVAKKMRDKTVCRFVKGNGNDYRDDPNRRKRNYVAGHGINRKTRSNRARQSE
jgi:hypothetical protein